MYRYFPAALFVLSAVVRAAQPSAPSPVAAPLRDLPWGQLNFLHTTDTHGWHAGHLQEPQYSADWGDYISFTERLRERADTEGVDLLLVDTGDRIEGNGLCDASDPVGVYTRDVFKEQEIDIICSGNHELYKQNSSENEFLHLVPGFPGNYLASNLDIFDPETGDKEPFAPRFRKFTTKNQGIRVVAFGFLFDFTGNSNNTVVKPVEQTIKEKWFTDAIQDNDVDLIVVSGHVGIRMEEFTKIFKAIRAAQWDTPIQFFGGHTHLRDYTKYDSKAYAIESGRYMETIGFQSISGLSTGGKNKNVHNTASPSWSRRYIDNNLFSFYHHTSRNSSTFPTPKGTNVSSLIASSREALKLDTKYGCAPVDLWTNRAPYPSNASVFSWLEQFVLPEAVVDAKRGSTPRFIYANTGAIRFDIFKGPFTRDTTYSVSPFGGGFRFIKDVPYGMADRLLTVLNNAGEIFEQKLPTWMLTPPEQISIKTDQTVQLSGRRHNSNQQIALSSDPSLIPGYTTKDDAGEDGDDTVHSPLTFYKVPNCIGVRIGTDTQSADGSKPPVDHVDVVYLEFVQPWILLALQFLGGEYKAADTDVYLEGRDFTTIVAEWVKDNWKDEC